MTKRTNREGYRSTQGPQSGAIKGTSTATGQSSYMVKDQARKKAQATVKNKVKTVRNPDRKPEMPLNPSKVQLEQLTGGGSQRDAEKRLRGQKNKELSRR